MRFVFLSGYLTLVEHTFDVETDHILRLNSGSKIFFVDLVRAQLVTQS